MAVNIDTIVLRFVKMPLHRPFSNRWERFEEWTKLIVEVQSEGRSGYGECTAMETPYYNYETIETCWLVIQRYLAPILLDRTIDDPKQVADFFSHIRGHYEARAALECACWDLYGRIQGVPLYQLIGGELRPVKSGATIGVHQSKEELIGEIQQALEAGYHRFKIKIKGGWDVEPLETIRAVFPDIALLADANGAYSPSDISYLASFDRFNLMCLEQPFPPRTLYETAKLQAQMTTPIGLDEAVVSLEDVRQIIELKVARIVNLKIGRVGGISEALRIHDACKEAGIPIFIGAKYEMGIGRWTNIALATLDNVTYPSDVSASNRYFRQEIVNDAVELVAPGMVQPLEKPGFGSTICWENLNQYMTQEAVIRR
ncbi:MAG TPA: o-succinylbenzoate synthase [Microcoleaceae bacterium UBA10368]|nr:o-succinylbenzoate synthase [Microcoleaceae cyanobacterium UBA10368]HCV32884.1 o-succinylbenzoate synthase [Microcoleaceae cyanobacterium UBA9251]